MAVPQLHYDTVPELPLTPSRNNEESPNVHLSPIMPPFERKEAQNQSIKAKHGFYKAVAEKSMGKCQAWKDYKNDADPPKQLFGWETLISTFCLYYSYYYFMVCNNTLKNPLRELKLLSQSLCKYIKNKKQKTSHSTSTVEPKIPG